MPRTRFILFLFFGFFVNNAIANTTVQASRYNISIKNNFEHAIFVELHKKHEIVETEILRTGQSISYDGYFSRSKLKNYFFKVKYNFKTLEVDKMRLENSRVGALNTLNANRKNRNHSNEQSLLFEIFASAGSRWHAKSDDAWWVKLFIGGVRTISKGYKAFRFLAKELPAINSIYSYDDLFNYLGEKFIDEQIEIQRVKKMIQEEIGWDTEIQEDVIAAAISYFEIKEQISKEYHQNYSSVLDQHDSKMSHLMSLTDNNSFSSINSGQVYDKALKPINFKTKSPVFSISLEPKSTASSINKYWTGRRDPLFVENPDDEDSYKFGNGWFNREIQAGFGTAISRELKLGHSSFARFYLSAYFGNSTYLLTAENYQLPRNFFERIPNNLDHFVLSRHIEMDQERLGGELALRSFLGRSWMFEISGGFTQSQFYLNFKNAQLQDGFEWAYKKTKYGSAYQNVFTGLKIGIGGNKYEKRRSTMFTIGVEKDFGDASNIEPIRIADLTRDANIEVESEMQQIRVNVGFLLSF